MFKVFIIILLYVLAIGYISMEYDWRDGKGRNRHLYLKGWQESELQEFIWVALFTIAVVGGVVLVSR